MRFSLDAVQAQILSFDGVSRRYRRAHAALHAGDTRTARALHAEMSSRARSAAHRRLVTEIDVWCSLCEADLERARAAFIGASSPSDLLRATMGAALGSDAGAVDVLADALEDVPALLLVTRALVGAGRAAVVPRVLARPGMPIRFADPTLHAATEALFRSGALAECEEACLLASKAFGAPTHHYNAACCASRLGDVDRALRHLATAIAGGFAAREQLASDVDLATVRADPRFADLLNEKPPIVKNG
ncbi:MAG: hypothetical protein KC657_18900 [Myxococcales bacterium]|nr:hypothetical protein [Myxococcales bacterium]